MFWLILPLACSWWHQCLDIIRLCFKLLLTLARIVFSFPESRQKQLSSPTPPCYPITWSTRSPGTAPLQLGCGCSGLSALPAVPFPMPLSITLIRNVHSFAFVISLCCLRPNYTICSGLSNTAHLLCEKQCRNPSLLAVGIFLLWSGKIRVMVGSAQHELFCPLSGCRVPEEV